MVGERMKIFKLLFCSAAAILGACTPVGERTQLSVAYYSISGESFDELDQQIALHGPTIKGIGRALAATNVRMVPDFRFQQSGATCKVTSARVSVKAHVTLPRLASQESLRAELASAWGNLERYAVLHEWVHVAIADSHAVAAEKAILALPLEADCASLRQSAIAQFRVLMAVHEGDQLEFDLEERGRIAALVQRSRLESRPRSK